MKKCNNLWRRVLAMVLTVAVTPVAIPAVTSAPAALAGAPVHDGDVAITLANETVNAIAFENTYTTTPYELVLEGENVLVGRELADGEFEFVLFTENGGGLDKVANANGKFTFAPIEITQAGVYVYRIAEAAGTVENVTYDATIYTVTVTVVDNGNGALVLDGEIAIEGGEAIVFTNTYTEPPVDTGDDGYASAVAMAAVAGGLFVVTLMVGKRRREDEVA